jgi:hypothetical protein
MGRDALHSSCRINVMRAGTMVAVIAALATACSGGDGPASVGVGSGQDPDPVVIDFPIAYTKGPLFDAQGQLQSATDIRRLLRFNVGTDLYLRDRASPTAPERNITFTQTEGLGDVMGVQISADGDKVLFSMRGPFDPNLADDEQPSWNVWEYEIESDALRRIIPSDINAEAGHDIWPHYLPDGRIVFSSTRQRQSKAILLDEGKPQFEALDEERMEPAFVLHVMRDDGSEIEQISFNQSHDLAPTVLDDGRVLFSRWDRAGGVNGIHLYTMVPDGTGLELLYGARSHATGTNGGQVHFVGAREMADGRIAAIVRPFDHAEFGGDIVAIETQYFVENSQPTSANAGMTGPAQQSATPNQVRTDNEVSPGGRFASVFPLWDGTGRMLVSWSICRLVIEESVQPCTAENLVNPDAMIAPPLYGIWMYDPVNQTQLPIVPGEEGVLIGDVVAAQPRRRPGLAITQAEHPELIAQQLGIVNIRSVYDINGIDTAVPNIATLADPLATAAAQRPARFLRLIKAVSIPDDDLVDLQNAHFGVSTQQGMREILGYAPVEPDGSVRITVPADVAFAVEVLDARGRRISARHRNWLQLRAGEELRCSGCHEPQSGLSHGRKDSFAAAYAGSTNPTGPFPNTDPALFTEPGETMAETRTRIVPAALMPDVSPLFLDAWTDLAVRAPDAPFAYPYRTLLVSGGAFVPTGACPNDDAATCFEGLATAPPTSLDCINDWDGGCRVTINYEQHIHPLWNVIREVLDPNDGITVLADRTCTRCHAPQDPDDPNLLAVPAANLNLTDGLSPVQQLHFHAYRQLLLARNEQEIVNGALQDRLVQDGVDDDGLPVFVTASLPAPMSSTGANASNRFFSRFDPDGSHAGDLSGAELRLIAEWLDIGAQYWNNPFDVPVD